MKCNNCGYEIPDGSKFCPECGAKIEVKEPEITLTLEPEMPSVQEEAVVLEPTTVKEWYFVENSKSMGTYSTQEMQAYLNQGRINASTHVWKSGMTDWKPLKDSPLAAIAVGATVAAASVQQPVIEKEPVVQQETKEWYYIGTNSTQNGPYNKNQMIDYVKSGLITPNTYVWATGMSDWVFAKNSELASYFTASSQAQQQTFVNQPTGNSSLLGITQKSIGLNILLSIVTCGIYGLYWMYTMANDVNRITARYGRETAQTSAGMVVLLSIVTCGIYQCYWLYKCGKRLSQCQMSNGYRITDDSIIMLVLAIFSLGIVSYCILQSAINDVITYGE